MSTLAVMVIGLAGLMAEPAVAVEITPGQLYGPGTRVESSTTGVSLTIPQGWNGAWPQDADFFVLESMSGQAMVLVFVEVEKGKSLVQILNNNIPLDEFTLIPKGAAQKKGKIWVADYRVQPAEATIESAHVAARHSGNTAVAFIGVGGPGDRTAGRVAEQLAKSVTIKAVKAPPTVAPGRPGAGGAGSWGAYMRGRYIVRFFTASGYTEKTQLWLCSDGSFQLSDSGGGFGGGASAAFRSGGGGQWRATGAHSGPGQLVLHSPSGQTATYQLSMQHGKLNLDGQQWLRDTNERCQ